VDEEEIMRRLSARGITWNLIASRKSSKLKMLLR